MHTVQKSIETLKDIAANELREMPSARKVWEEFNTQLTRGTIRAAEKNQHGTWEVNTWVKEGILLGFKIGMVKVFSHGEDILQFSDKDTLAPVRIETLVIKGIRIVPGGSSVRTGAFLGDTVIVMPPSYINIGAYIGSETMIDSHVLVGSCAQIGRRCHISAGVQIGGVLEPVSASPCIIEDDVLMGIHSAIAEGVIISSRAVIGAGVIITSSTPIYDVVHERVIRAQNGSLIIPEDAVVIPGSRVIQDNAFATENQLHIATPIIKKYRDSKTDAKTALEMIAR